MAEETFLKLYTDEDVDIRLAQALRQRGYDVKSTLEAGNCGVSDEEQLTFAIREERVLLTHNIKDFAKLHKKYLHEKKTHFGILLCDQKAVQGRLSKFLQYTLTFLQQASQENMLSQMKHLEGFK